MRSDIAPGARFPDYELPDQTKALRKLKHPSRSRILRSFIDN